MGMGKGPGVALLAMVLCLARCAPPPQPSRALVECGTGLKLDAGGTCRSEGACAIELTYWSELSSAFVPFEALYAVDDRIVARWVSGDGERVSGPAFRVAVTPGEHVVKMRLQLRGNGEGRWSYLKGYKFEVRSSHKLVALPDRVTEVATVAYENGTASTPMEERPALRWGERESGKVAVGPPPATPAACVPAEAGAMTTEQREVMAVARCRNTTCMFTRQEEQLLVLAESSGRAELVEAATRIREQRHSEVDALCARLRAEGKL
jgi:hypothetical protein